MSLLKKLNKFLLISRFNPKYIARFQHKGSDAESIISTAPFAVYKTPLTVKVAVQESPFAKYGGEHYVTLIPGNGVGPELIELVREVLQTASAPLSFEVCDDQEYDEVKMERMIMTINRNRVALKGYIQDPKEIDRSKTAVNVLLRSTLDLYLSITHIRPYPNVPSKNKNIDMILARQNTEGEYKMLEHSAVKGLVENMKITTRLSTEKFARKAFEFAVRNRRRLATVIHNKAVYAMADSLFVDTVKEVALEFPSIHLTEMRLQVFINKVIRKPDLFQLVLTPNLYANPIAHMLCGVIGGPGLLSRQNFGDHHAVFEPAVRTLASTLVGKNEVNPVSMLNCAVDLLRFIGLNKRAKAIEYAILQTLSIDKIHTRDLGGCACTSEVINKIKYHVQDYIYKNQIYFQDD